MKYLIWSNEHRMWWRAGHRGYTLAIDEAGRYDAPAARAIVDGASLAGPRKGVDVMTSGTYLEWPEVMVLAPEHNPE